MVKLYWCLVVRKQSKTKSGVPVFLPQLFSFVPSNTWFRLKILLLPIKIDYFSPEVWLETLFFPLFNPYMTVTLNSTSFRNSALHLFFLLIKLRNLSQHCHIPAQERHVTSGSGAHKIPFFKVAFACRRLSVNNTSRCMLYAGCEDIFTATPSHALSVPTLNQRPTGLFCSRCRYFTTPYKSSHAW